MLYSLLVMTGGVCGADPLAARRLSNLLLPARNLDLRFSAVTNHRVSLDAGIAGTLVAPGQTFVIFTIKSFPAHLLTGSTISSTTFLVAGMLPTVSYSLTLYVTRKLLRALDLFTLRPTPTRLRDHLEAGGAIPTVTPFSAVVCLAGQYLPACVSAGRCSLGTGQSVV
jgi:hypothetical protein